MEDGQPEFAASRDVGYPNTDHREFA